MQIYPRITWYDCQDIPGDLLAYLDHQDDALGRLRQSISAHGAYDFCASFGRVVDQPVVRFMLIVHEVLTVGSPAELAKAAAARKSSMLLLPYGIPIAIGTIAYFVWTGMLR